MESTITIIYNEELNKISYDLYNGSFLDTVADAIYIFYELMPCAREGKWKFEALKKGFFEASYNGLEFCYVNINFGRHVVIITDK